MYRFRTMFELSDEQIRKYIRMYHRRMDWPVLVVFILCAAVFLILTWAFDIINVFYLKIMVSAVVVFIFLLAFILFKVIRIKYLRKNPPFAIGPYLTLEVRDGYFNVNCSGVMKGFPKKYLNGKICKNGDYILTNKKDMIVIPKSAMTPNIAEEIKAYFK